jgi:hypothetical protein
MRAARSWCTLATGARGHSAATKVRSVCHYYLFVNNQILISEILNALPSLIDHYPSLVLMALIQMFAADLAQIDELHYHTFNPEGTRAFNAAQEVRNQLHARHNNVAEDESGTKSGLSVTSASLTVPALLQDLYQRKYQWGMSDGN